MKFKLRNAFIAVALYLYVLVALMAGSAWLVLVFAAYAVACMAVARAQLAGAEARRSHDALEFSRDGAANSIGKQYGSFHHVYHCDEDVNRHLRSELDRALRVRMGCAPLRDLVFRDVDHALSQPESRTFAIANAPDTPRMSRPYLLCCFANAGSVQSVRWWIIVSGLRDPNKVFWRYALAPFTIPFVSWPYYRREYDPVNGLLTVYPGFFNGVDVLNRTRELQYVAFETLVDVLNHFGIDTSDLKNQRGNVLNVNVSGGQASFGAVVQGAMNRVMGRAEGAKE